MKTLSTIVTALALLTPLASPAANFEGRITMKMTAPNGQAMPMTYSLKSGLMRVDLNSGQGMSAATIIDPAKQQMIVLMPQQKMYMVRPLNEPGAAPTTAPREDVTVQKTNEHAKILGYDTTKYLTKSHAMNSEVWVTDQLGTFGGLGGNGPAMHGPGPRRGGAAEAWQEAFRGKDAFPLRVITTDAKGRRVFEMEATSIEKVSLPDTLFTPPADYRKFDMGEMMRGMMPGGMRPPSGGGE